MISNKRPASAITKNAVMFCEIAKYLYIECYQRQDLRRPAGPGTCCTDLCSLISW